MFPYPARSGGAALGVGLKSTNRTSMFPYSFNKHITPEDLQRAKAAKDAKELKEYLDGLTPEARAKFWAEIEGKGDNQEKQTPSDK